jgi:hypothetical protein
VPEISASAFTRPRAAVSRLFRKLSRSYGRGREAGERCEISGRAFGVSLGHTAKKCTATVDKGLRKMP